ncbi:MAG: rod shape-determining protein MreD [Pseudomonadota bacterium]
MIDVATWRNLRFQALYVVLALGIVSYRLLPLGAGGGGLATPDLMVAITFAWALRHPAAVPMGLVVAVFLISDFLLQRPPGLWAALVLLLTEALKTRRLAMAELNFAIEWAFVTGAVFAVILAERMVLWVLFAPQTSLGLSLVVGLSTAASYPFVVLVSQYLFGLRKLSPADTEQL